MTALRHTTVLRSPRSVSHATITTRSFAPVAQAGSRSLQVQIRPAIPADAAVRIHSAGVEGTRSVWASVTGQHLVQVIAFERYESTGGVLDRLGALVRGGQLLDVR